jgi:hypothetical protein
MFVIPSTAAHAADAQKTSPAFYMKTRSAAAYTLDCSMYDHKKISVSRMSEGIKSSNIRVL